MEALVGFLVGYYVGTRHGRDGLRELLESAEAIRRSPETRRLVAQGVSAGAAAGGSVGTVVANLVRGFTTPGGDSGRRAA
jgi:hypothetical protein